MIPSRGLIGLAIALGLGIILFGLSLSEFLHLAQLAQAQGFQRSAARLRGVIVIEVVAVAGIAALVMFTRRTLSDRLGIVAALVWILGVLDTVAGALAGAVPR